MEKPSSGYQRLKAELIDMRSALRQSMDKGLSPADREVVNALTHAVDAADVALDALHAKLVAKIPDTAFLTH
ncbi:hypothetical protein LJC22_06145 [Desulfosarcina sp. OttesenSCG-928-G10]|nr:hypothetical protein [Desulfosarcina sp. OttesenSCG-928-G10]